MSRPRAVRIGGSLGGLCAAHALRAIGWDADVFERVPENLASRGTGLGTHDGLFDSAAASASTMRTRSRSIITSGSTATDASSTRRPMPRIMTAWTQVSRPLRDTLPAQSYHPGRQLARFERRKFGEWIVANSCRLGLAILQRPQRPGEWSDPADDPRIKTVLQDNVGSPPRCEWGEGRAA